MKIGFNWKGYGCALLATLVVGALAAYPAAAGGSGDGGGTGGVRNSSFCRNASGNCVAVGSDGTVMLSYRLPEGILLLYSSFSHKLW